MRIDENGVRHVTLSDVMNDENNAHLLACEECQQAFPNVHWVALVMSRHN